MSLSIERPIIRVFIVDAYLILRYDSATAEHGHRQKVLRSWWPRKIQKPNINTKGALHNIDLQGHGFVFRVHHPSRSL